MQENEKYLFSVVIAVYNAEEYLEETVQSLINQTIGFEKIQLILVDDGSVDQSALICDRYAAQYSNVVALHQQNTGVSAARNLGLAHIKGKYVNFLDSDDKLSHNAMEEAAAFFAEYQSQTDVVSMPLVFFDGQRGQHVLNYKFKKGTRLIDLKTEYNAIQLSMSSTFVSAEALEGKKFDTRLAYAEDAKLMQSILIEKETLGVIPKATYYYRRHSNGAGSAIQSSTQRKAWYLPYMTYFQHEVLDWFVKKEVVIPKFIQFTLLYDLQWRIKISKIPVGVLTEQEEKDHRELVEEMFHYFDDDVILAQKNIGKAYKLYILREKYGHLAGRIFDGENICLTYGNRLVTWLSSSPCKLEFLTLKKDRCVLEGTYEMYEPIGPESGFQVRFGYTFFTAEVSADRKPVCSLGTEIMYQLCFRVELPLEQEMQPRQIHFYYVWNGNRVHCNALRYGKFFPLTGAYANAYFVANSWKLTKGRHCLHIAQIGRKEHLRCECRFLKELWKKNNEGARKAVIARIIRGIAKTVYKKPVWLISDRESKADDNGEAFFLYMQQHKEIKTVFMLKKDSPDFQRLKKVGTVLPYFSYKQKMAVLLADCIISSAGEDEVGNPFGNYKDAYKDILTNIPYVFLQHGIIKDDLSGWLCRESKNLAGFVTSAFPEYQSIMKCPYHYKDGQVWLTGLPRYDRLYCEKKRFVTVMPTWRRYLMVGRDEITDVWKVSPDFKNSSYFQFYNGLINNAILLDAADRLGFQIQFFPHPALQPHLSIFDRNDRVKMLSLDAHYRDIYAESGLVITDYSSAVFDFAYLERPVIYCQFDVDEFFAGEHTYSKGYFDYERDGFGEVEYDLEHTVDRIIEYMENGCQMKEKYKKRVENFFAYHDKNNCQRVYDKIIQMLAERNS